MISVSKRYVETEVEERSGGYANAGQPIFNIIDRANDRRKEKEKGYNYEKNKYHCLVLTVAPLDEKAVDRKECREYAFVLHKKTRAHIGQEPQQRSCAGAKVLSKIEKRIWKILKKAEKKTAQQVCQNTFRDAFQYAHSPKYEYKTRFCGKERSSWDMIFMFSAVAIVAAVLAIAWGITKLV